MKTLYNKARNDLWEEDSVAMTVIARFGTGGGNTPLVLEKRVYDASRRHGYEQFNEVCETVQAKYGTGGAMCR